MLEMNITIAAPDLAAAINTLAAALDGKTSKPTGSAPIVTTPVVHPTTPTAPVNPTAAPVVSPALAPGAPLSATPAQTATPIAPTIPVAAPALVATPAANVTPAPVVPTSAPQYTLDMIASAGATLIDAGKMEQLMQLLDRFGVKSLTELSPENYGAIATELRALGAAI